MRTTKEQEDTIDAMCSGYAFCEEDARELVELAEIGRLYCEHRKAAREYDVCDYDHAPTLEAHALRYDRTFDALRDAYNTYLAKKIKP